MIPTILAIVAVLAWLFGPIVYGLSKGEDRS